MNHKLKALGLALVAALALTALTAPAASAAFTSDKFHTSLVGSQLASHSFSAGSGFGAISCTTALLQGTSFGKEEATWVLSPTYSGCKDSLSRTVHVDNSGLTYTFTANTNAEGASDVHIGGSLTWTITNSGGGTVVCTVTITSSQTTNGILYKNLGGTNGVEVRHMTSNFKSKIEGGFFNCGTKVTDATAGTLSGATLVTGKEPGGSAAAISVHVP